MGLICKIPSTWRDVSQVRQVPDHQEVYQDCSIGSDGGGTGSCLIIEILERETTNISDNSSSGEVCSFFWNDLADANSAPSEHDCGRLIMEKHYISLDDNIDEVNKDEKDYLYSCLRRNFQNVPNGIAYFCMGKQLVIGAGMRTSDPRAASIQDWVIVQMCILRLEHVQTDLIISLSTPIASKNDECKLSSSTEKAKAENIKTKKTDSNSCLYTSIFGEIVASFKVIDWSLFV